MLRAIHGGTPALGPICFPQGLPAAEELKREIPHDVVARAPAGALRIAVFNIMPKKEETERQIGRLLSSSDHAVEVTLVVPDGSRNKNTRPEHIAQFYKKFSQIKSQSFDGVVVTGAPVEHLPLEDVKYINELYEIFDWVRDTKAAMYSICWGAMASLYHFHGVPKHLTDNKLFGVFPHERKSCPLTASLQGEAGMPVSRHATWHIEDMAKLPEGVEVVLNSPESGPCVIWDSNLGHAHVMNHWEYEADTLEGEYQRDLAKGTPTGEPIHVPGNYYPGDDPSKPPNHSWKANSRVFWKEWLGIVASRRSARSN